MSIYTKKRDNLSKEGQKLLKVFEAQAKTYREKISAPTEEPDKKEVAGNCGDNNRHLLINTDGMKKHYRQMLEQVEKAMVALKSFKYGICRECGFEIPTERLKVQPFAIHCKDCKEEAEKQQNFQKRNQIKPEDFTTLEADNPLAATVED